MRRGDVLSNFVHDALKAGQAPAAIATALTDAGWSQSDIQTALGRWRQAAGLPPVPRPGAYVSAREAVLYGVLFISLGQVAVYTVIMGIAIIDWLLPDPNALYLSGREALRWPIAALIAFLPLFLFLNRRAARQVGDRVARQRSLVRRWIGAIMTLIAILVMIGDLVTAVYFFLNGDLSQRFALKVVLVGVMGALVLVYCKDELDD